MSAAIPAATLTVGDTLHLDLSAHFRDPDGDDLSFSATTSAEAVTTVALSGDTLSAAAVGAGEATITATAADPDGLTVSQDFAVTIKVKIANVIVTPDAIELTALEGMVQLSARAFDTTGEAVPGAEFSWSSRDNAVATVDAAGVVTATGRGETIIGATAAGVSGMAVVSVAPAVQAIRITPPQVTIAPGDTVRLSAAVTDRNRYSVAGAALAWTSSDPAVATVAPSDPPVSALAWGVGEGAATITVSADEVEATVRISVSPDADRIVLSKLYEATSGPNWKERTHWLTGAPLRTWYGVQADAQGRVTGLRLADNGLAGTIPPELGALERLRTLDLSTNDLSGPIPPELGALAGLEELSLEQTVGLTGPIPAELAALVGLRALRLSGNRLSGQIPPELGSLPKLEALSLWGNQLTGAIPPELGSLSILTVLDLRDNGLAGPIPPELGSASTLEQLYFSTNDLTGPIPPELADLPSLQVLFLDRNELTGPIPRALRESLPLLAFRFQDNRIGGEDALCAPGTSVFVTWLEEMEEAQGPFCNAADIAVLRALYELTGGDGWNNRGGWLGGPALDEWYGVTVDSLGRVLALDVSVNGLAGRLNPTLARLEHLRELRIDKNALSGPLPLDLTRLPLREFDYSDTDLCAPADPDFQAWLGGIASHEGTEVTCDALTDRDILVTFYHSAGGPGWLDDDKWLSDAPVGEWKGVKVDQEGRVTKLELNSNHLEGSIPPELASLDRIEQIVLADGGLSGPIPPGLGSLSRLDQLWLNRNRLTGHIPPALGSASRLRVVALGHNRLTGPIPAELGSLPKLAALILPQNDLTGPIPPELAGLDELIWLELGDNRLSGEIPPGLGSLTILELLDLSANDLTGPIPSEFGELGHLQELQLERNDLTGPVPPELGNLARLTRLLLYGNARLSGPLPSTMTALGRLEELQAEGTSLCVPSDPGSVEWLLGVSLRRMPSCDGASIVYLTQAAQSRGVPVPLVARREALLRVFVTAARSSGATMPAVRATFFQGGAEVHVANIPRGGQPIPTEIDESSLSTSANIRIPGRVLRPGLEMVIEVDPDGTLSDSLGLAKRIPETGRTALDVRVVPVLDLTLIPFLLVTSPDSSIVGIAQEMAADSSAAGLALVRALLPVRDLAVTAHEPVWTSSDSPYEVLPQTEAIRVMEGRPGYYMGLLLETSHETAEGLAYFPGTASVAVADPQTIVHELGHNLSLDHAPCRVREALDPAFPHAAGSIGIWGYDFTDGGRLVPPSASDFMGFCFPLWTSDYSFAKALAFRATHEVSGAEAAPTRSLLVWGGTDAAGEPYIEPAFVVDAPPALPAAAGDFRLEGTDAEGRTLFSLSFDMPEVADGGGGGGFAFALPVRPEWAGALAAITLTGPDGFARLDGASDRAAAIFRDPRSGQVRGILRDLSGGDDLQAAAAAALADLAGGAAGAGLDVRVSRGIPAAAEWRR